MVIVLMLLLLAFDGFAATTHYVRTPGATYGAGDGSTYANAWTGLTNINWASVSAGDTIYLCGTNVFSISGPNQYYQTSLCHIKTNNITFRGDYAPDPACLFGGCLDNYDRFNWTGPDINGVYYASNLLVSGSIRQAVYEIDNGQIYFLNPQTNTTWTSGQSGWFFDGTTNWLRTVSGNAPSNNIAISGGGFKFDLNYKTNLTFLNLMTIDEAWEQNGGGWWGDPPGYLNAPTNIVFNGVTNEPGQFALYEHMDHWSFLNCQIGYGNYGIYAFALHNTRGPDYLTVSNYLIHDTILSAPGQNKDLHGIGFQAGNNATFINGEIRYTGGTAIDMYGAGTNMTNITVAYDFIHDIHGTPGGNNGGGIECDSGSPQPGQQLNMRIFGNIVTRVGIGGLYRRDGIHLNTSDPVYICNNDVEYAQDGISVDANTHPVVGTIENNIVANTTNTLLFLTGSGLGSITVDYNLFYRNKVNPVFTISPSFTHDAHSVYGNPLFAGAGVAADFKIPLQSPAVDAGTSVGLTSDFIGTTIPQGLAPDIGAFEYPTNQQLSLPVTFFGAGLNYGPVVTVTNLSTGLLAYYRFEEGSGANNAVDATGNGRTLTQNNSPGSGTGIINNCRTYTPASSQYFSRADETPMRLTGDFTWSVWINYVNRSADMGVISKWGSSAPNIEGTLYMLSSAGRFTFLLYDTTGASVSVINTAVTVGGVWYHLVVTKSGTTLNLYVNNVAQSGSSASLGATGGTAPFEVGAITSNGSPDYWNGSMDELGVWNRALSATEVGELFNSGAGRDPVTNP